MISSMDTCSVEDGRRGEEEQDERERGRQSRNCHGRAKIEQLH